jgi:23S rRNA (uracil-5-)-methyltransferase RumA
MKTKIIKMGINGEGIAYNDKKPIFVPRALIDEIVDVEIKENFPTYQKGEVTSIVKKSKYRVVPKCKVQHICGGCPLMILNVAKQCEYKRGVLKETLIKYAGIDSSIVEQTVKSPDYLYYRNQLKWPVKTIKDKLETGMYKEGSNHLVTIESCIVHDKKLEIIKNEVMAILNKYKQRDYYDKIEKGIRYIALRGFETFQLTIVSGSNIFEDKMIEELMAIDGMVSVNQCVNTREDHQIFSNEIRNLAGSKTIQLEVNGLKVRLAPKSFFQLNRGQAEILYKKAIELLNPAALMVEAYCGVGVMSMMAAEKMDEVIGIESVNDAVKNAKINAKMNHLEDKVKFIVGDSAEKLWDIVKERDVNALLLDPPRAGLDDDMLETIINSDIEQIVYIACNSATLAKNLAVLKHYYNIKRIIPYDMFTHTAHVETLVLLEKIK